jgi:hypothetical protein
VQRHPHHHHRDAEHLRPGRHLREHNQAHDGRRSGEQRHHQRVRRPLESRHRELVKHIRDHRGTDSDADAGEHGNGIGERPRGAQAPDQGDRHHRNQHRTREPVHPAPRAAPRRAVREHDVAGKQDRVRECERESERPRGELDVGQHVHARDGEPERAEVAWCASADSRERDHGQELDCGDGAERQPRDRLVERAVHRREHEPPRHQQPRLGGERPPRPSPEREHDRGRRDPEPRDPEHRDTRKQQHRERRPQVVEHRATDEVQLRGWATARHRPA